MTTTDHQHCPICWALLAPDGSHITPAGAHIPAEPQPLTEIVVTAPGPVPVGAL